MIKAFNVTVISGDGWFVFPAIELEGKLWFAPKSSPSPDRSTLKLDILVRFDNLKHGPAPGSGGAMHAIFDVLPRTVLEGHATEGFEFLVTPDLVVQRPEDPPTAH